MAPGGPTIGPVTLALGKDAERGVPFTRTPDGTMRVELVLLVDARPGEPIEAEARRESDGAAGRFTHFASGTTWASAKEQLEGAVPDRGQDGKRPADMRGNLLVREPGCYEIVVTLDGERYGSFGIKIGR